MEEYIEYLREFIGKEWILKEIKKIEDASQLKELGTAYIDYHPFVNYHYEIKYLLRKAEIEKSEDVLLEDASFRLYNAGALLETNINKIADKDRLKMRLRSSEEFDDTIWELEVCTMLQKNNIDYNYKNEILGDSNDINCKIDKDILEIECKNREVKDKIYDKNRIFSHMLVNKLSNHKHLIGKTIEIAFEEGFYEDIKKIDEVLKKGLDKAEDYNILGKYRIIDNIEYRNLSSIELMNNSAIIELFSIGEVEKKKLFKEDGKELFRIVFKFPNKSITLKNLEDSLKKANKQLPKCGVLFLKVPGDFYQQAVDECKIILNSKFSNLIAIKIISLDLEFIKGKGTKLSRKEELIENNKCEKKLTQKEYEFLSGNIAFSKFK